MMKTKFLITIYCDIGTLIHIIYNIAIETLVLNTIYYRCIYEVTL